MNKVDPQTSEAKTDGRAALRQISHFSDAIVLSQLGHAAILFSLLATQPGCWHNLNKRGAEHKVDTHLDSVIFQESYYNGSSPSVRN